MCTAWPVWNWADSSGGATAWVAAVDVMRLRFVPIHLFRETPQVTFFDASVPHSNGTDVVVHSGAAVSPPDDADGFEQYYVHQHQVDHNLVLEGERCFILLNPAWAQPHHVVQLVRAMGALEIPVGTFHRSVSSAQGSLVLNQSIRDGAFDYATEFVPVSLRDRPDLQQARAVRPWLWSWQHGHIRRSHGAEAVAGLNHQAAELPAG